MRYGNTQKHVKRTTFKYFESYFCFSFNFFIIICVVMAYQGDLGDNCDTGSGRLSSPDTFLSQSASDPPKWGQYKGFKTLEEELQNYKVMSFAWNIAEEKNPGKSIEDIAIYAYSLATDFYKELNKSTRIWKWLKSEEVYPYKNYVNLLLKQVEFYPQGLQLYRGVPAHYKFNPRIGTVFKSDQIGSASLDPKVGHKFTNGGTFYKIKTKFAIPILDKSHFPDEQEYLIPFGMDFIVNVVEPRNSYQSYDIVHIEQKAVPIHSQRYKDLVISNSTMPICLTEYTILDPDLWYTQWRFLRSARNGDALQAEDSSGYLITSPFNGGDEQNWYYCWDYSEKRLSLTNIGNGKVVSAIGDPIVDPLQLTDKNQFDERQQFFIPKK